MLQILDAGDDFLLRIVNVDIVVESLLDDHVEVLVDRAVNDPATVLTVVIGQIRTTAKQADTQGRLSDDHMAARTGHSRWACSYALIVPISRK